MAVDVRHASGVAVKQGMRSARGEGAGGSLDQRAGLPTVEMTALLCHASLLATAPSSQDMSASEFAIAD